MPIVRALPNLQSGRAFLELRNDFDQPVTLKGMFLATGSAGPLTSLLDEPKELAPGKPHHADITEKLRSLFTQDTSEAQEKVVNISLNLEPEPPNQPQASHYILRFEDGRLTQFSSG